MTWRSLTALLFAAAIVQPLVMYLYLVGSEGLIGLSLITWGGGFGAGYSAGVFSAVGGQILWLVVLLWSWFAQLYGRNLTVKETFIIFTFYPITVGSALLFINPIFNLYVANSFIIKSLGLAQYIPSWWAPTGANGLMAYAERSLLSPYMLVPIGLLLTVLILTYAADISLGIFAYQRFAVMEKLDFPAASTQAIGIVTIAERETSKIRVLMLSGLVGFIFGLLSWLLPTLMGSPTFRFIPRGLTDFTYLVETQYPGASFGVDLSWIQFALGFVVPLKILTVMMVTSVVAHTAGDHLLVQNGVWPDWAPGYGLGWNFLRSNLYFWTSVTIGLALAAAFVPMALHPRMVIRVFTSLGGRRRGEGRPSEGGVGISGILLLLLFFGSTAGGVLLFTSLLPDFPIYLTVLFVVGWSFFATMVSTNSVGVTWGGFGVPYLKESMIYYSGYQNPQVWFAPLMLSQGGVYHSAHLKMGSICGVTVREYVKALLLSIVVSVAFGFLYASLFWRTAPIPSSIYKFTVSGWPVMALEMARMTKWLWTGILFKTDVILGALGLGSAIAVASDLLGAPWLLISMVTGLNTLPSMALPQFVGGLISKFMERSIGRERWGSAKPLVVIGITIGDGLSFAIGSGLMIVSGSMWSLPY
ncbi:MAG: hypothetical protein QW587_02505 [Candidatus Bathyarchaeia archaeon]